MCGQDARTTRVLLLISVLHKIGNCCISCHSSEGINNCGQDTSPFIVSTDDPILFADSVIRLSNLKSVVGEFARNFVTNNYYWDVTANTILKEYEASLTRKLAGFTKNI